MSEDRSLTRSRYFMHAYETQEEAEAELHEYAETVKNMGITETYGAKVEPGPDRGWWSIWLVRRK